MAKKKSEELTWTADDIAIVGLLFSILGDFFELLAIFQTRLEEAEAEAEGKPSEDVPPLTLPLRNKRALTAHIKQKYTNQYEEK
ncbi:hypothetical protein [Paenibacillus sp. 481]|uniref:hypothetical protein n=1 Tax=Paenibacillus sp. 481 TaxID=2835869 RepID=UPI001E4F969B|nr:hypothetical protein [Paenibacillus sp. 481]UHA73576.1 hypothetical protein KIK04_24045 [Paenibacillus sp. 481]